jgi:aminobenzoyl-glutamate utilization protein B
VSRVHVPLRALLILLVLALTAGTGTARAQIPTGELSALPPAKRAALEAVDELAADIQEMSMTLWSYAETAMLEHRSAAFLADLLEEEGFQVERGVAEMPTAFVASYTHGQGGPAIGVLAEYDALPGVGNDPVPGRTPRADGITSGQGCGHNLFGAGSVGAAIAIKRAMERQDLSGTIRLYGTPAEETVVGKVYMAKAGLFDDLDAALEWHPGLETQVRNQPGRALNNFTVDFRGQAAHSSADPWNGRSALDAVELMNHGVNMMREHIQPTARIHYVIPSAGEAPNVVPEYARVWYYVRDTARVTVTEYYDWILDIAEGAAIATRTEHDVHLITGVHEMTLNRPLQEATQRNLELVGPPRYPDAFQTFATEMQRGLGIAEKGLDTEFNVTSAPADVPWHSWATTASHGTEWAVRAADVAARVLALTGVDLLTDPDLVRSARAFFEETTGGEPYRSPIPQDQKPPVP